MPTDGEGNTSHDAAIAREILDAAQQQQRNWDDAANANGFDPSEHLNQSARIAEANACRDQTIIQATALKAGPDILHGIDGFFPTSAFQSRLCVSDSRGVVRAWIQNCDAEGDLELARAVLDRLNLALKAEDEESKQRLFLASKATLLRELDEARAALAKLESAQNDLKIDRDQACFERDELHKAVNRCSKDIALSYSLQRQTTSERDEARKQLDIIKAERDELAKALQAIVSQWDSPNFLTKMILVVEDARTLLSRLNKQGGAS